MLFLNLKNYPQASGPENLTKYIQAAEAVVSELPNSTTKIVLLPSQADLSYAVSNTGIKIGAQNVDYLNNGNTTGWTTPNVLMQDGISYAVVNHSEHRIYSDEIVQNLINIQQSGIKLIVCCENLQEAEVILEARPYAIAYEDKDLIGSGKSITDAMPNTIKQFVDLLGGQSLAIIGAGISTGADVQAALNLGAKGCILASAFVKADNPTQKLKELVTPLL